MEVVNRYVDGAFNSNENSKIIKILTKKRAN